MHAIARVSSLIVWRMAPDGTPIETWASSRSTRGQACEPLSEAWLGRLHPEDRACVSLRWRRSVEEAAPFEAKYRLRQKDGSYRWARGRGTPLWNEDGTVREWIGTTVDIHDRIEAENLAALSSDRLRLALESTGLGIWDCDLRTGCIWLSQTAARIMGCAPRQTISIEEGWTFVHPEDVETIVTLRQKTVEARSRACFETRFRILRADNSEMVWVSCSARYDFDGAGKPVRLLGTVGDITEERKRQETLFRLAHYDHLTGLPNRRRLAQKAAEFLADGRGAALLLINLDGFRDINDRLGHDFGDELLQTVARQLRQCLPSEAILARVGSDEFAAVLPATADKATAAQAAERLQGAFAEPLCVGERMSDVSISIGVAIASPAAREVEALMVEADLALRAAKATGPASTHFFTRRLKDELSERQQLIDDLQAAVAENQFELYYQPQVRLGDRAVVAAEALLRWRHPVHGLMMPRDFLTVLGKSKWARSVGDWVIGKAAQDAATLAAEGHPLRIAVNLFAAQFRSNDLEHIVRDRLATHGLPGHLFEIEITEHVILSSDERTLGSLSAIRALGCSLAFDDYGTGYASLSMLKRFPLTRLKIDRSFIAQLCDNAADEAIVDAILSLGRTFDLAVTAEGVETPEQEEWLKRRGCGEAQGFLFGGAMPLVDLSRRFLASGTAAPCD